MRGADISSDHHLLVTAVRLWFKRYNTNNNAWKKFQHESLLRSKGTQAAFKIIISKWFQPLQELIQTVRQTLRYSWNIA
jgi:hypothetical protein